MSRPLLLFVLVAAMAGACSKNIGDPCGVNTDCSLTGDRFCDIAPPGGYCTVEGCDETSCPGDSVCIRFYTPLQTESCDYSVDNTRGAAPHQCAVDERCLCDSSAGGTCMTPTAHCAPEDSERRWCMKRCDSSGDCRDGYTCRETGTLGAEPVPYLMSSTGDAATFCVSSGSSS